MKCYLVLAAAIGFGCGLFVRDLMKVSTVKAQSNYLFVQPVAPSSAPFPRSNVAGSRIVGFACATDNGDARCFVASQ